MNTKSPLIIFHALLALILLVVLALAGWAIYTVLKDAPFLGAVMLLAVLIVPIILFAQYRRANK